MKTRNTTSTTEIFPLWPPFFSQRKVLHWSRAVYAFFFPERGNKKNGTTVSKTGTMVRKEERRCPKPERVYIRQDHPFTKPPFSLLSNCDWNRKTGVPRPSGPEIPKSLKKVFPCLPARSVKESVEKVIKSPKKSQKGVKISVRGLFRHFFGQSLGGGQTCNN